MAIDDKIEEAKRLLAAAGYAVTDRTNIRVYRHNYALDSLEVVKLRRDATIRAYYERLAGRALGEELIRTGLATVKEYQHPSSPDNGCVVLELEAILYKPAQRNPWQA